MHIANATAPLPRSWRCLHRQQRLARMADAQPHTHSIEAPSAASTMSTGASTYRSKSSRRKMGDGITSSCRQQGRWQQSSRSSLARACSKSTSLPSRAFHLRLHARLSQCAAVLVCHHHTPDSLLAIPALRLTCTIRSPGGMPCPPGSTPARCSCMPVSAPASAIPEGSELVRL